MSALRTPWHVEHKRGLGPIVVDAKGAHIATVYAATQGDLIAAAPDLRAALQTMVDNYLETYGDEGEDAPASVKAALAAIAKATGSAA